MKVYSGRGSEGVKDVAEKSIILENAHTEL